MPELVPVAQALRSEAQRGHSVTICPRQAPWCFGRWGYPTAASRERSQRMTVLSPIGVVGEQASFWSPTDGSFRQNPCPSPLPTPEGGACRELGGRCSGSSHPRPAGKGAWGADRTKMGSAEWESQEVLGLASSSARGTWFLAWDPAAVPGWTRRKGTNRASHAGWPGVGLQNELGRRGRERPLAKRRVLL